MTTDKSEQHFAMESLRYIHSQMHSWGSRSISWVRPIQFCHLTHYSLKPLPQLNFQKDGLRNSMDPFPSEPTIKNKNNHLKSLRIILRAYSKWRTLIQKNHLNLSSDSESLRWATVQPLLFPLNVSEKEALPHDNGTWNTRLPTPHCQSGAALSPQEGLATGISHPPSFMLQKPCSRQEGLRGLGLSSSTSPHLQGRCSTWSMTGMSTLVPTHLEGRGSTLGEANWDQRWPPSNSSSSRVSLQEKQTTVSTPAPEHLPREKGRLWSSPQKN